jgi:mRNA-degrading endonuclease RelE of RelBE toxin-antitoxin system
VDTGEYRIYYEIDDDEGLVIVYGVGKRGDDEFYKELKRKGFLG